MEVESAYYSAPPGWISRRVRVQWDGMHVRLLDPKTGQLLREHLRQERGRHCIQEEDRPAHTPVGTLQLLARAAKEGQHIGTFCRLLHERQGEPAIRRIQGLLSLHRKYGVARVEEACSAAEAKLALEDRYALRREKSAPIVAGIHERLLAVKDTVLPKSKLGEGVGYALGQWPRMIVFLDHARIELSNNPAENSMRPVAVGRNYAQLPIMRSWNPAALAAFSAD